MSVFNPTRDKGEELFPLVKMVKNRVTSKLRTCACSSIIL